MLRGDAIGTLLVSCHQQLQKTRHPRHARHALAPLKALLALLGSAVTVPSTFRYASTILLQQLNNRWACKPAALQAPQATNALLPVHKKPAGTSLLSYLSSSGEELPPMAPTSTEDAGLFQTYASQEMREECTSA